MGETLETTVGPLELLEAGALAALELSGPDALEWLEEYRAADARDRAELGREALAELEECAGCREALEDAHGLAEALEALATGALGWRERWAAGYCGPCAEDAARSVWED